MIIPIVSGLAGLYSAFKGGQAADAQRKAINAQGDILRDDQAFRDKIRELALAYDPAAEDQAAVDLANQQFRENLNMGLRDLNADFGRTGGLVGQDTRFNVQSNDLIGGLGNSLRQFLAERRSTQTQRKLAALGQAATSGGDLVQGYRGLADQNKVDLTGTLTALGTSFDQIINRKKPGDAASNQDRMRKNSDANGLKWQENAEPVK